MFDFMELSDDSIRIIRTNTVLTYSALLPLWHYVIICFVCFCDRIIRSHCYGVLHL